MPAIVPAPTKESGESPEPSHGAGYVGVDNAMSMVFDIDDHMLEKAARHARALKVAKDACLFILIFVCCFAAISFPRFRSNRPAVLSSLLKTTPLSFSGEAVKEFYRETLRHKTPLSLFIHYIQCNIPVRFGHVADRSLTHMLAFPLTRGATWQCSLTWVTSRRLAGGRRSRRNLGPLI